MAMSYVDLDNALQLDRELALGGLPPYDPEGRLCIPARTQWIVVTTPDDPVWFWKMPRRWWADPLNPVHIVQLLLWIPINVVYLAYQLLKFLLKTTKRLRTAGGPEELWFGATWPGMVFGSAYEPLGGRVPFAEIRTLRCYATEVVLQACGETFVISTEDAAQLLVLLSYLAPRARITRGLPVSRAFLAVHPEWATQPPGASRHGSGTWTHRNRRYRVGLALPRLVGLTVVGLLVLMLVIGSL